MAAGQQLDELTILRLKLAEAEAVLDRERESAERQFRDLLESAPAMVWIFVASCCARARSALPVFDWTWIDSSDSVMFV